MWRKNSRARRRRMRRGWRIAVRGAPMRAVLAPVAAVCLRYRSTWSLRAPESAAARRAGRTRRGTRAMGARRPAARASTAPTRPRNRRGLVGAPMGAGRLDEGRASRNPRCPRSSRSLQHLSDSHLLSGAAAVEVVAQRGRPSVLGASQLQSRQKRTSRGVCRVARGRTGLAKHQPLLTRRAGSVPARIQG